tara:strand:+ start:3918 stop:4337 length:420 start_codon:yes stop_codon:yes gene_type:complete
MTSKARDLGDFISIIANGTSGQVLTIDDTAVGGVSLVSVVTLGTTITTSRDLADADFAGNIFYDVAHATVPIVLNIPLGLTETEPVTLQQTDVADVSFTAAGGVTIQSLNSKVSIAGQYASVTLVPKGSNVYALIGALK